MKFDNILIFYYVYSYLVNVIFYIMFFYYAVWGYFYYAVWISFVIYLLCILI